MLHGTSPDPHAPRRRHLAGSKTTRISRLSDALRLNAHCDCIGENWRKLSFYFCREDHYWKVSSLAAAEHPGLLGPYPLDFGVQLRDGHYTRRDDCGLPVRLSRDGRSFVHNYTRVCGFALANWEIYLKTGDKISLAPVLATADYILRTAEHTENAAYLRAERPEGHTGELSSMSQGQAMSVLCRAWEATRRSDYLDTALACLQPFTVGVNRGGVLDRITSIDVPWYEEYPTEPTNHVLNGMIFAVWGLKDLAFSSACPQARELYEAGIESIVRALPLFDTGYWSWYSISDIDRPYVASMGYHNLHVALLEALFQQTRRDVFRRWSETFLTYAGSYRYRLRAAAAMIRAKCRLA
jgi:D-glucuronyl C5-epimerase C-terminus